MLRFIFSLSKRECNNDCNPTSDYLLWKCTDDNFQTFTIEACAESEEKILELWPKAYQIEVISDVFPSFPAEYQKLTEQLRETKQRLWQIRREFGEAMPFKVGDTIECEEGCGIIKQIDVREDIHHIDVIFNPFKKDGTPSLYKRTYRLNLYPKLHGRSVKGLKINGKELINDAEDTL